MKQRLLLAAIGITLLVATGGVVAFAVYDDASMFAPVGELYVRKQSRGKDLVTDPRPDVMPDAAPGAPNVVLVITCTLRKDQITPYGGPAGLTPFLSDMAKRGVKFDDLIAAAPWTRPASTAIVTGQHAVSIGMVEPDRKRSSRKLSTAVTTAAEHFRGAGYATFGLTANPNINASFGFQQGFDAYHEASGLWRDGMAKVNGDVVVSRAFRMLDGREGAERDRPFYLQMLLVDAHAPANVTDSKAKKWQGDDDMEMARYRALVHRLDANLARLGDGLRKRGYSDRNTLFVVVSDHGEGLNIPEHHGIGHGNYMYETVTAIPWFLTGPGVAGGHVVRGVASQVDVLPTVLGLAGIETYEGPGRDHTMQVSGSAGRTERTYAYTDTWFHKAERSAVFTDTHACQQDFAQRAAAVEVDDEELGRRRRRGRKRKVKVRKNRKKKGVRRLQQVFFEGGEQEEDPFAYEERVKPTFYSGCFDRVADPDWNEPMLLDSPRQLMNALEDWRVDRVKEYEAWEDKADGHESDEVKDQLEALGYHE